MQGLSPAGPTLQEIGRSSGYELRRYQLNITALALPGSNRDQRHREAQDRERTARSSTRPQARGAHRRARPCLIGLLERLLFGRERPAQLLTILEHGVGHGNLSLFCLAAEVGTGVSRRGVLRRPRGPPCCPFNMWATDALAASFVPKDPIAIRIWEVAALTHVIAAARADCDPWASAKQRRKT